MTDTTRSLALSALERRLDAAEHEVQNSRDCLLEMERLAAGAMTRHRNACRAAESIRQAMAEIEAIPFSQPSQELSAPGCAEEPAGVEGEYG